MNRDQERLLFVQTRDGLEGAISFARRCVTQYRRACLMYTKQGTRMPKKFRIEWAKGYIEAKRYLKEHVC